MNLRSLCHSGCRSSAPPTHVAVSPSCKPSLPERLHRSTQGAGNAEGKIEGDSTAKRLEPDLHEGSRGTREKYSRAAPNLNAASVLGLPRAAFAAVCRTAMELRHDQA
jgi:hypothetical protein